jgi:hypothetical protein
VFCCDDSIYPTCFQIFFKLIFIFAVYGCANTNDIILGKFDVVKWLIRKGNANLKHKNKDGHAAWRVAGMCGHLNLLRWLFAEGELKNKSQSKVIIAHHSSYIYSEDV